MKWLATDWNVFILNVYLPWKMLDFAYAFPLGNDSITDAGWLRAVRIQLVSSWTSEDGFWPESLSLEFSSDHFGRERAPAKPRLHIAVILWAYCYGFKVTEIFFLLIFSTCFWHPSSTMFEFWHWRGQIQKNRNKRGKEERERNRRRY